MSESGSLVSVGEPGIQQFLASIGLPHDVFLDTLFRCAHGFFVIVDSTQTIRYASAPTGDTTYAQEQVVGMRLSELLHAEDHTSLEQSIKELRKDLAAGRDTQGKVVTIHFRSRLDETRDWREFSARVTGIQADSGRYYVAKMVDLTENANNRSLVETQNSIVGMILQRNSLHSVLGGVLDLVTGQWENSGAAITRLDSSQENVTVMATTGLPAKFSQLIKAAEERTEWDVMRGKDIPADTVVHLAAHSSDRKMPSSVFGVAEWLATTSGFEDVLVTPIIDGQRQRLGYLLVYLRDTKQLNPFQEEYLLNIANLAAVEIEQDAIRRSIEHKATHDATTGLLNRSSFVAVLEMLVQDSVKRGETVAVISLDIRNFLWVNSLYGEKVADALLGHIGEHLQKNVNEGDLVARSRGDKFLIALRWVASQEELKTRIKTLWDGARTPYQSGENRIELGFTLGVAVPENSFGENIIRCAEAANAHAKKRTDKENWVCYDKETHEKTLSLQRLAVELAETIEIGGLALYCQPIMDLSTERPLSIEAMVRWDSPSQGPVSPNVFIPLAEEHNLIAALTRWVLGKACEVVAELRSEERFQDFSINVNISPRQLVDPEFVDYVKRSLAANQLDPAALTLEVTEHSLMEDSGPSLDTLNRLQSLGVGISIDDFGTGYNSLANLKQFGFDEMKIDRSFVSNVVDSGQDRAIVNSINWLAQSLGAEVVAEGIETAEQAGAIKEMGVQRGQGFLWSKPVPLSELVQTLDRLSGAFE